MTSSIKSSSNISGTANGKSEDDPREVEMQKKTKKIFKQARMAVCKVKPVHGDKGIGAFYEVVDRIRKVRFLFITCNNVLPTNSLDEIAQAILEFEDNEKMKLKTLDKKQIKYAWTSKSLGATIVEISAEYANLIKTYATVILKVGQIAPKAEFAMLHYSTKDKFAILHGEIETVNGHEVSHQITTSPGSCGSPLLDWNCVALAMHGAGKICATSDGHKTKLPKAVSLSAIIEAYFNDHLEYVLYSHQWLKLIL